jgi:hypothetical protein
VAANPELASRMQALERLHSNFDHHPPDGEKAAVHEVVRAIVKSAATHLHGILPEGREKSLAMTKLEEALFWANAAVARNNL